MLLYWLWLSSEHNAYLSVALVLKNHCKPWLQSMSVALPSLYADASFSLPPTRYDDIKSEDLLFVFQVKHLQLCFLPPFPLMALGWVLTSVKLGTKAGDREIFHLALASSARVLELNALFGGFYLQFRDYRSVPLLTGPSFLQKISCLLVGAVTQCVLKTQSGHWGFLFTGTIICKMKSPRYSSVLICLTLDTFLHSLCPYGSKLSLRMFMNICHLQCLASLKSEHMRCWWWWLA